MKKTTVAAVLVTGTVLAAGIFAKCDVLRKRQLRMCGQKMRRKKRERRQQFPYRYISAGFGRKQNCSSSKSVSGEILGYGNIKVWKMQ